MKKNIGIIITVLLTFIAWYFGFFQIIFYILGFYAALYFISIIFKTTVIISTILGGGIFLFYIWTAIWSLWLLYISLSVMFTESFFMGIILLVVVLPIAEMILYGIAIVLGFVLGYPLIWFSEDLEKRFGEKEKLVSDKYINNENEILDYEDLKNEEDDIETKEEKY
ncbi:MAG: hypothetical protein KAU07_00265 [Candidatus Andersenbacteria bacterium]|nr:hypothetical protein [Candidatus Andersenbacteria bacterium]